MDYFSKFLKTAAQPAPKVAHDRSFEFHKSWNLVKNILSHPDERQLTKGIKSTVVPAHLQLMVDTLVWESAHTEDGDTGGCFEYLLKHDVLGTLVRLSETDRPFGIQAEVLRAVQNMVVLLDEQFLVPAAVHRAVLRLLRNCVGDDLQEQLDGRNKAMGAAGSSARSQPSEYEEDLVNLLCILCSRIRTYRELLMIFFHDKHWYHSEPLFAVEGDDVEVEDEADELRTDEKLLSNIPIMPDRSLSPTPSQATVTSAPGSSVAKKPEYEFLLFNYLLRYVHREGQIGDFARAGLLFLMDIAMAPVNPVKQRRDAKPSPHSSSDPIADAALALAEYILDGDFSEVLGAGLGAVYSLLPSKLEFRPRVVTDAAYRTGMVLGGGDPETDEEKQAERERRHAMGLEDASNPDFRSRLDHFLKLLEFLQDVLRRNITRDSDSGDSTSDASTLMGTAISQSILEAVQQIFLENVLYPSVLECSDNDGSAVAVMSYIEIMIRTLQEGQLSDLLVNFLTSEDNEELRLQPRPYSTMTLGGHSRQRSSSALDKQNKLRRRKSSAMVLLEMEAPKSSRPSEYFTSMGRFTLKDLLISNLRSESQPTATAALQLLRSLLLYHPRLSVDRLLIVFPDANATSFPAPSMMPASSEPSPSLSLDDDEEGFVYPGAEDTVTPKINSSFAAPFTPIFFQPETTYSTHEREMGLYLTLVSRVDPSHNSDTFSTRYDHYLHDALLAITDLSSFRSHGSADSRAHLKHCLNPNDPILSVILGSLRKFFFNTPEHNIALTGVLATLSIHPDRSLAGWLTFAVHDTIPHHEPQQKKDTLPFIDDGDDRSIDFRIEENLATESNRLPAASMNEQSRPVVHSIFHNLVGQLERYRLVVDNFDKFLLERRQGLLFSENLTDALTLALELADGPSSMTTPKAPIQRPKPKTKAPSFVSFLTPKKNKPRTPPVPSESATPPSAGIKNVAASPFGPHYQKTSAIVVEPFIAPMPPLSLWTPPKATKWSAEEDDVFSGQWEERQEPLRQHDDEDDRDESLAQSTKVTLSHLLDNVVILEESVKELVAIIHARRSLGIDPVRYL